MRLFLAIKLPETTKKELALQLKEIKKEYPYFRWVPKENYHITLHFFGEVKDKNKIIKAVEEMVFDIPHIHLYSIESGLFVYHNIAAYIQFKREKNLERLVEKIKDRFGPGQNKKFVPHLTIARYRLPSKQQYLLIKKKIQGLEIDINFAAKNILLLESIFSGKNQIYREINSFPLMTT